MSDTEQMKSGTGKTKITRGKLRQGISIPGMSTPLDDLSEVLQTEGGEVVDRGDRIYFKHRNTWFWIHQSALEYARVASGPKAAGPGRPKKDAQG